MSLISSRDFPGSKVLTGDETFESLFERNEHIKSHASKPLLLPATTLTEYCYANMFQGCTNLSSVKCLATNIFAVECTTDWLSGVAANGTFTKAASMTGWTTGANGIPSGWTVVDAQ